MPHHVLIVDDDPDLRKAIGIRVQAKGYRTTFAADGAAALKDILSDVPDLVLLDLMLPGGSGYALLERLRNLPRLGTLPVLVISGCDPGRHEKRTLEAGACGFLRKPIRTGELMRALEKHLPRTKARVPVAPSADGPTPAGGGGSHPIRVLVVDDDPDLRSALSVRLRANGYQVCFASDAVAAVQAARQHDPQVILLDLGLPAGDGFAVMQHLRQHEPAKARDLAFQCGAVAFLTKPVDTHVLLESLRSALQMTIPQ